jgi:hypothetical protein
MSYIHTDRKYLLSHKLFIRENKRPSGSGGSQYVLDKIKAGNFNMA